MMVVTRNENPISSKTSVHRFFFPHPLNIGDDRFNQDRFKSIFFHIGKGFDRYFTIGEISSCKEMPTAVCEMDDHRLAIGCVNGDVVIVDLKGEGDNRTHSEYILRESGPLLNKVFGLFQAKKECEVKCISSEYIPFENDGDHYLFTLCGDNKLRIWSLSRRMIIMTIPINLGGELSDGNGHCIRIYRQEKYAFTLSITINFTDAVQCHIYEGVIQESGELELIFKCMTSYPCEAPIDNQLSQTNEGMLFWGLFRDGNDRQELLYTPISLDGEDINEINMWKEVILHNPQPPVISPSNIDVSEAFLDVIFEPNRFGFDIVVMALSSFTNRTIPLKPVDLTYSSLRDIVRNELEALYTTEEGGLNQSMVYTVWNNFLIECVNIWESENEVLGLFCPHDSSHFVFIVRKYNISIVRQSSFAESMNILMHRQNLNYSSDSDILKKGTDRQLLPVLQLMGHLENELGPEFMERFEDRLAKSYEPYSSCYTDIDAFLGKRMHLDISDEKRISLRHLLPSLIPLYKNIPNFADAIEQIYNYLELDLHDDAAFDIETEIPLKIGFYASNAIDYVVVQSIRDILKSSYSILRNLLIVAIIRDMLRPDLKLTRNDSSKSSMIQKKVSESLKHVYALRYLSNQPITRSISQHYHNYNSTIDPNSEDYILAENSVYFLDLYYTVVKHHITRLFNNNVQIQNYLYKNNLEERSWVSFTPFLISFIKHLHPKNIVDVTYDVLQTMLNFNQFITAQNYIRIIHQNSAYHEYVLGVCYLNTGEYLKAIESFSRVADIYTTEGSIQMDAIIESGLHHDTSVESAFKYIEAIHINSPTETESTEEEMEQDDVDSKTSMYWKYIISYLRPYKRPEVIVELSNLALANGESSFETTQFFWANVFANALSSGQYDIAYMAVISNPSREKQENSIAHFVTELCENGKVDLLLSYPFGGFQDLVDKVLENKAKKSQLDELPNYYHILYAFNIKRRDYSRAASAMYNCAQKEAKENDPHLKSLKNRCYLLLACLNALKILDPQNAWILIKKELTRISSKRKFEGTLDWRDFEEEELCDFEIKYLEDVQQMYTRTRLDYEAMLKHHAKAQHVKPPPTMNF